MSDTAAYLAEARESTAVLEYSFEQLTPAVPVSRDALSELVAQAELQAAEIRARAREEGYAEGHAAGHADGLAAAASAAQALGEALTGVIALREEVSAAVERDAIKLAVALAEKILAGALEAKPELVGEVAQGALRRVVDRRRVTLLVNPSDLETVKAALSEAAPDATDMHLDVQADPRVLPGGAIAQSDEGEVDACVPTQLARARELMMAAAASST